MEINPPNNKARDSRQTTFDFKATALTFTFNEETEKVP